MLKDKIQVRDSRDGKFLWMDKSALLAVSEVGGARAIAVYTWLCHYSNAKTQKCYPSITTIAQMCKMKRHTVIDIIRKFEELSFIRVTRKIGKESLYDLLEIESVTSVPGGTGSSVSRGTGVVSPGAHEQYIQQDIYNNKKTLNAPKNCSKDLQDVLKAVSKKGFQVYQMIGKFKQQAQLRTDVNFPDEVILAVCQEYLESKIEIRNTWGWFVHVMKAKMNKYFAEQSISEGDFWKKRDPSSLKSILTEINLHSGVRDPELKEDVYA